MTQPNRIAPSQRDRLILYAMSCACLISATALQAADGDRVIAFGDQGVALFHTDAGPILPNRIHELPGRRILVAGNVRLVKDPPALDSYIAGAFGFLPGGAVDNAYGIEFLGKGGNGWAAGLDRANALPFNSVLQDDGAIAYSGTLVVEYPSGSEFPEVYVSRWTERGGIDFDFNWNGVYTQQLSGSAGQDLALRPDGRLVYAGSVLQDGTARAMVGEVSRAGQADTGFGGDGHVSLDPAIFPTYGNAHGQRLLLQPNGRMLLAATEVENPNHDSGTPYLLRLLADGSVDSTFGMAGKVNLGQHAPGWQAQVVSLARLRDERILIALSRGTTLVHPAGPLIRLNPDGSLDPTFGANGVLHFAEPVPGFARIAAVDSLGRTLLVDDSDQPLKRLLESGQPDPDFGNDGGLSFPEMYPADGFIQQDGSILVTGEIREDYAVTNDLQPGTVVLVKLVGSAGPAILPEIIHANGFE